MKTRTDLKAGLREGQCHMKVNRFGQCKKILCPYPPFKFPCYRKDLIGPGPIFYGSELDEEETAGQVARRLQEVCATQTGE